MRFATETRLIRSREVQVLSPFSLRSMAFTAETTACNVCDQPADIRDARDSEEVSCDLREFGNKTFTVWRCANCLSLHSKEAVDLDQYYRCYLTTQQKLDFFLRIAYLNRLSVLIRLGLARQHRILDFGCGSGLFVDFLKRRGFDVTGYDPYIESFADKAVLRRGYDAVLAQDVIEHEPDPRQLLITVSDVLKENGILLIGCPNATEIDLHSGRYLLELHQPYHRHILSEQALLALSRKIGFKPIASCKRWYGDTFFPFLNMAFLRAYVEATGGYIDIYNESPRYDVIFSSPKLLFLGLFGRFLPRQKGNMVWCLQKVTGEAQ